MTDLEERILEILRSANQPLLAREIVHGLQAGGLDVDKSAVNACLHGRLRGRVQQNSTYRWVVVGSRPTRSAVESRDPETLRPAVSATSATGGEISRSDDRLRRFTRYYLDCVREDESEGASFFFGDEDRKFLTLPLSTEWCGSGASSLNVPLGGNRGAFAKEIRQRGQAAALFYGYPLFVRWLGKTKSGWTGGIGMPLFLMPVQHEWDGSELRLHLDVDWPRANPEALKALFDDAEERRLFLEGLGLLALDGDPPEDGLTDIVRRMTSLGLPAESVEDLDPDALRQEPPLQQIDRGGLYNRAVVVVGERSKFTKGLEKELELLESGAWVRAMSSTSLATLFDEADRESASPVEETDRLVEVVPLNDEQRAAVRSGFTNRLTVVTGPPGTGKSQVVTTLLANAYVRGQRALFTSRNHQAVDVVVDRLNSLVGNPVVVRLGGKSGDRNLREELQSYLSRILAVNASDADRRAETEAKRTLDELQAKRARLWEALEAVRVARNNADALDAALDADRERFRRDRVWDLLWVVGRVYPEGPAEVARDFAKYHGDPTPSLLRRVMRVLQRSKHFPKIDLAGKDLVKNLGQAVGVPPSTVTPDSARDWVTFFEEALQRLETLRRIAKHRDALQQLSRLPAPDSFAPELADTEDRMWHWGAQWISAYGKLLPDRLDRDVRRAVGEYRATLERLADDQIGGAAYAKLRAEQERLFGQVSTVLPIWAVTNLSARGSLPFEAGLFDLAIIDEASQCDIPSALPILYRASRAVIIGDPMQLRHITKIAERRDQQLAAKHELTEGRDQPFTYAANSLFDLAATRVPSTAVQTLREHFRSHADIVEFSNRRWYGGTLRVCTDYRRLKAPRRDHPAVIWTDVAGAVQRPATGGALNPIEAERVASEVEALLRKQGFQGTVGVVTPFRAQANRIRELLTQRLDLSLFERALLVTDTAHGFQGDERDVVVLSPVVGRETPRGARYFLSSTDNLFNVAITRARALLHVVGDHQACGNSGIPHIEEFAKYVAGLSTGESRRVSGAVRAPAIGPWEPVLQQALEAAGLRPMPQYQFQQYYLDLAIVDGDQRIDIEVDGEYYHKEWDGSRCREDVIRDVRLMAQGWVVKRLWVYQVRDELDRCVAQVLNLVQSAE